MESRLTICLLGSDCFHAVVVLLCLGAQDSLSVWSLERGLVGYVCFHDAPTGLKPITVVANYKGRITKNLFLRREHSNFNCPVHRKVSPDRASRATMHH